MSVLTVTMCACVARAGEPHAGWCLYPFVAAEAVLETAGGAPLAPDVQRRRSATRRAAVAWIRSGRTL